MQTREEKNEYLKKYHALNRYRILIRQKAYYEKNKAKIYERSRSYISKNIDKIKEYKHQWYLKNIDKCKLQAKFSEQKNRGRVNSNHSIWKKENRDKANKQMRRTYDRRYHSDVGYRLRLLLRSRLKSAVKNDQKTGSAVLDLGCTISELKAHLEKQFQPGMAWGNWSLNGWHIDHIIPITFFDITDREQLLKACHYTNLQPLWSKENLIKNNKITQTTIGVV